MISLALLRVAPLLSATSYATFTFSGDTFIRPSAHTAPSTANRILPGLHAFTRSGLPFIFLSYPVSIAAATANLMQLDSCMNFDGDGALRTGAAAFFYLAGLIFTMVHFPFWPIAMAYLDCVGTDKGLEGDPRADNTASMVSWFNIHTNHGLVTGLLSWGCYLAAFMCAVP
ncbi:hypothetical protein F4824DRAFT_516598 [Ustulina deusta]|nr:hypothetical protein F4823DRAFT_637172 [Ustulina deusta]KAI3329735.1 hypothetical protein F4824DRAFT_516598 [Ustulina deusta]